MTGMGKRGVSVALGIAVIVGLIAWWSWPAPPPAFSGAFGSGFATGGK